METEIAAPELGLPVTGTPGRYAPTRPNGKRVPGWEDTNVTALAQDMGVSYRYLLGVLVGSRNTTLSLLQNAAGHLGMPVSALVERLEQAQRAKLLEAASSPGKVERRRERSERRAIQSQ